MSPSPTGICSTLSELSLSLCSKVSNVTCHILCILHVPRIPTGATMDMIPTLIPGHQYSQAAVACTSDLSKCACQVLAVAVASLRGFSKLQYQILRLRIPISCEEKPWVGIWAFSVRCAIVEEEADKGVERIWPIPMLIIPANLLQNSQCISLWFNRRNALVCSLD